MEKTHTKRGGGDERFEGQGRTPAKAKRYLADSLLAGTNISARLTAEDLLQLMNDE